MERPELGEGGVTFDLRELTCRHDFARPYSRTSHKTLALTNGQQSRCAILFKPSIRPYQTRTPCSSVIPVSLDRIPLHNTKLCCEQTVNIKMHRIPQTVYSSLSDPNFLVLCHTDRLFVPIRPELLGSLSYRFHWTVFPYITQNSAVSKQSTSRCTVFRRPSIRPYHTRTSWFSVIPVSLDRIPLHNTKLCCEQTVNIKMHRIPQTVYSSLSTPELLGSLSYRFHWTVFPYITQNSAVSKQSTSSCTVFRRPSIRPYQTRTSWFSVIPVSLDRIPLHNTKLCCEQTVNIKMHRIPQTVYSSLSDPNFLTVFPYITQNSAVSKQSTSRCTVFRRPSIRPYQTRTSWFSVIPVSLYRIPLHNTKLCREQTVNNQDAPYSADRLFVPIRPELLWSSDIPVSLDCIPLHNTKLWCDQQSTIKMRRTPQTVIRPYLTRTSWSIVVPNYI
ncbi:hypothetical protein J6590_010118 [Homalodisca vitripennis]|nr:hypothetical protein J6590_010118 [Homalodisca vitripennis]